ncbi:MAG TPA: recombinase family protein, partial [Pseudonocardiaceae bacterium]|nr:recombinase family protein [Pseudonocardiaceae bacterium]
MGVARQLEDCRQLAARNGDTVTRIYSDNDIGASTRSRKPRPEYQKMIKDARDGLIDKIIAYTSGRLTRRPREHEDLIDLAEQLGVAFGYVASPGFDLNTAAGRRVARILAATDAGEAEDISERARR